MNRKCRVVEGSLPHSRLTLGTALGGNQPRFSAFEGSIADLISLNGDLSRRLETQSNLGSSDADHDQPYFGTDPNLFSDSAT